MDKPNYYEIKIKGQLDKTMIDWFEGLTVSNQEGGDAILAGYLPDQAALQGILNRISSLGLTLISVNAVPEENVIDYKEKKMNSTISHSDLIRRRILRVHGSFLLILTPIMTTVAMIGWALGKGPFALWHDIQFATPGLFQAYLLMFVVGVVLWTGSYQEGNLRKWDAIGLLAHIPPLVVNFIFLNLFLSYHFEDAVIFSITLHTIWIFTESFAILYKDKDMQQGPAA